MQQRGLNTHAFSDTESPTDTPPLPRPPLALVVLPPLAPGCRSRRAGGRDGLRSAGHPLGGRGGEAALQLVVADASAAARGNGVLRAVAVRGALPRLVRGHLALDDLLARHGHLGQVRDGLGQAQAVGAGVDRVVICGPGRGKTRGAMSSSVTPAYVMVPEMMPKDGHGLGEGEGAASEAEDTGVNSPSKARVKVSYR